MSEGNRARRQDLGLFGDRVPELRRCMARSSRTGHPCQRPPIKGSNVCRSHGGAAPQVIKKARERAQLYADAVVERLGDIALQSPDERAAIAAGKELIDIAGVKAASDTELKPWEQMFMASITGADGRSGLDAYEEWLGGDDDEDDEPSVEDMLLGLFQGDEDVYTDPVRRHRVAELVQVIEGEWEDSDK